MVPRKVFNKYPMKDRGPRRNEQIRSSSVRVIGADGQQIGVLSIQDALSLAQRSGLDLVEISPNVKPPVCKIIEWGKYKYDLEKKRKSQKATIAKLKEVKLGVQIEENDFRIKLRAGEQFLYEGNKLKISLFLRRYQMPLSARGRELVQKMVDALTNVGSPDGSIAQSGPNISVLLSPLPKEKRVLVHNTPKA